MLKLQATSKFRKDYKRIKKRGLEYLHFKKCLTSSVLEKH